MCRAFEFRSALLIILLAGLVLPALLLATLAGLVLATLLLATLAGLVLATLVLLAALLLLLVLVIRVWIAHGFFPFVVDSIGDQPAQDIFRSLVSFDMSSGGNCRRRCSARQKRD